MRSLTRSLARSFARSLGLSMLTLMLIQGVHFATAQAYAIYPVYPVEDDGSGRCETLEQCRQQASLQNPDSTDDRRERPNENPDGLYPAESDEFH